MGYGDIFEYDNKEWQIVEDESISPADHCTYCDFCSRCEKYIDDIEWFACGCTFHAESVYIKEVKNTLEENND